MRRFESCRGRQATLPLSRHPATRRAGPSGTVGRRGPRSSRSPSWPRSARCPSWRRLRGLPSAALDAVDAGARSTVGLRSEHNREVLRELLGLPDDELDRLAAAGVLSDRIPEWRVGAR